MVEAAKVHLCDFVVEAEPYIDQLLRNQVL